MNRSRLALASAVALALAIAAAPAARAATPTSPRPATEPAEPPSPPEPRPGRREPVLPPPLPPPLPPSLPPSLPPPASQPATRAAVVQPSRPPPTAAAPPPPASQPAAAEPVTAGVPIPDPVAYWAGLVAGRRIRERLAEDGRGLDDLVVLKGVIDGLADHDPAYPRADVQAAVDELQANVLQRRAEKRAADDPAFRRLADDEATRSRDLLAENAKLAGVRTLPDGVEVRVLHDGTGRPVASAKVVTARLTVSLADGTLVAATTEPARLVLADVLPALADAARGMRVGDRWQVVLPPDKAYGLAGNPPMIGPNQAIAYDVEVVDAE